MATQSQAPYPNTQDQPSAEYYYRTNQSSTRHHHQAPMQRPTVYQPPNHQSYQPSYQQSYQPSYDTTEVKI